MLPYAFIPQREAILFFLLILIYRDRSNFTCTVLLRSGKLYCEASMSQLRDFLKISSRLSGANTAENRSSDWTRIISFLSAFPFYFDAEKFLSECLIERDGEAKMAHNKRPRGKKGRRTLFDCSVCVASLSSLTFERRGYRGKIQLD